MSSVAHEPATVEGAELNLVAAGLVFCRLLSSKHGLHRLDRLCIIVAVSGIDCIISDTMITSLVLVTLIKKAS